MFLVFAVLVGLIPVIPAVLFLLQNGKTSPAQAVSRMVQGFTGFNFLVGRLAAGLAVVWLPSPPSAFAAGVAQGGAGEHGASRAAAAGSPVCMGGSSGRGPGSGAAAV